MTIHEHSEPDDPNEAYEVVPMKDAYNAEG
jgi:hypothetical protein